MSEVAAGWIAEARRARGDARAHALQRGLDEVLQAAPTTPDLGAVSAAVEAIGGLWEEAGELERARTVYVAGVELLSGWAGAKQHVAALLCRLAAVLMRMSRVVEAAEVAHAALARSSYDSAEGAAASATLLQLAELGHLPPGVEGENTGIRAGLDGIWGRGPAVRSLLEQAALVAPTDASVLLLGETGTGKELMARAIHRASARKDGPFVTVDCTALPEGLIENELFGHERGAFTGAAARQEGRFESADGGTIFLDEIGDMPLSLQSKLLRVLQQGEFQRLGSPATRRADVRVLAATHRDIAAMVRDERFRADLYYRLSVVPLQLPPLRERREDIPLLVWYFIELTARRTGKAVTKITPETIRRLLSHDWPGNVRELNNVIERAVILARDSELRLSDALPLARPAAGDASADAGKSLEDVERDYILTVLDSCSWKVKGRGNAADVLKMNPSTLRSRMRKLDLLRPDGS
jgi:transcriptional regulator with GAF, ATPase, and Fis domain